MRFTVLRKSATLKLTALLLTCLLAGCGDSDSEKGTKAGSGSGGFGDQADFVTPTGDASVKPAEGGPGFAGEGWEPTQQQPPEGSDKAVKGGAVRYYVGTFPTTIRPLGKDSNSTLNSMMASFCLQTLLGIHSDTLEYTPQLATHWQISEDKMTFRFRINPAAHFSDGKPVTSQDVIASFDLFMDTSILEPAMQILFGKFERPTAVSKYIVEVKAKEKHWRNFMLFSSSLMIFSSEQISGLSGDEFLKKFQFQMPIGSGPYMLQESDIKQGESITFRRRSDFWGWNQHENVGLYNFDLIRLLADAKGDSDRAFEQAKKGQIDILQITKAQDWVEAIPELDTVKRGLLLRRRIYNDDPIGLSGIAINMRNPPLDDVRVRRALSYLQDREELIDKLFYNEYTFMDSYFAGTLYANPDNPKVRYNPELAQKLLTEAGWSERGNDGILVKDGKRLEMELYYASPAMGRVLTVFQEKCKRAGIDIILKESNFAVMSKMVLGERKFQLTTMAWATSSFPDPETEWSSVLADQKNNSNIPGFKNERADQIIKDYATMFELPERIAALQELDGIIFETYPYVLGWGLDNKRLLYWNKFSQPEWYLGRTSRSEAALSMWWYDAEKDAALKKAKNDGGKLDPGEVEVTYWKKEK